MVSIPRERETMVDLLVIKNLVENSVVQLKWIPATHMLADILTKRDAHDRGVQSVCGKWQMCVAPDYQRGSTRKGDVYM